MAAPTAASGEPLLIDAHCHLDSPVYNDLPAVLRQSHEAGVSIVIAAGTGQESNVQALGLHHRYPHQVWAALGLHPERPGLSRAEVEAVISQIEEHRSQIVAVGEVGLPYYALREGRMTENEARQREIALDTLVRAAARLGLPVVLHAPHDAAPAALSILRRNDPRGVLFHWHKASPDVTRAICDAGYFVSVTPEVCYRERDQEMVRAVPLDNLLLESDGPWAYGGEFAGQPTTPALVARVAEAVAEIKGVPLADVKQATTENALRLFGRWR